MDVPFADSTKLDGNDSIGGGGGGGEGGGGGGSGGVCSAGGTSTVDDIGEMVEYVGTCNKGNKLLRYRQVKNPNVKPITKKKT